MLAILLLLIALVFLGFGFATHALLWIAFIILAVWILGWLVRPSGRRWYYW